MSKANRILLEEKFDGNELFANQLALVKALLSDLDSPYYISETDIDKYQKAQTRLKTYISQLLSSSVSRNITEEFKEGLQVVISKRLGSNHAVANKLVSQIIDDLREKNSANSKKEIKDDFSEQFVSDLENASYLAIITSKPLEIDLPPEESPLTPLRKLLFTDLIKGLFSPLSDLKKYRFNFPMPSYGQLFWRGVRRILINHVKKNASQNLIDVLFEKFAIKTETWSINSANPVMSEEFAETIVDETLQQLNRNGHIMVFISQAPIYSLPLIIFDPTDFRKITVYAILETETPETMSLFKLPDSDIPLWRIFVWDQMKSKKYAGEEVKYSAEV